MNNYRVTFAHHITEKCDYWNSNSETIKLKFKDLPNLLYPTISLILKEARELGIKYIWFFYEPYVEITWLSDDELVSEELFTKIDEILKAKNIKDVKRRYPVHGNFGDWFCNSDREMEFGAKRHDLCRQWIELYNEYKDAVDDGKGLQHQVRRTIHTLCNPLGLNFLDEARICFWRGILCLLFRFFLFKRAIWIYTKIFRQKY